MELNYKAIGKRIKIARIKAELTQERLAEMASISVSHMSNIETGTTKVSLSTIVNLANALSVTVDDLLCDNLVAARPQFERDIQQVLDNSSPYELRIIKSMCNSLLDSLKENEQYMPKD